MNQFHFKQFKVNQQQAAMKVNTDGVLLGAWVNVGEAKQVLDLGTGTGTIALMLAQRCPAKIIAIEIEKNAAEEAANNCKHSPWQPRLEVLNTSFQAFLETTQHSIDLIVSNPPFFSGSQKNHQQNKSIARHNDLLPFATIADGAIRLLRPKGTLALILPTEQAVQFVAVAQSRHLFPARLTRIHPKPTKPANRWLMQFTMEKTVVQQNSLCIYHEDGKTYTPGYKNLTKEFYLHF